MKVLSFDRQNYDEIRMDDGNTYRRYDRGSWEVLIGDRWDKYCDSDGEFELERAYLVFI